jgi:hypothetical protein
MIRNTSLLPHRFIPAGNRSVKADRPERLMTFHQSTLWDTCPDPAVSDINRMSLNKQRA